MTVLLALRNLTLAHPTVKASTPEERRRVPDREFVENLIAEMQQLLRERARVDDERYAELKQTLAEINGNVGRMKAEIGLGLPDVDERGARATLRDRVHRLEDDDRTLRLLADGMTAQLTETAEVVRDLKTERDNLAAARELTERRWTRRRVVIVTGGTVIASFAAVIGALGVILRLYGVGGG